jgi:hypothetical protein
LQQRDPRNPLRFQVLLREGDVMRKQYEFSNALDVYDEILNDNTWRDLPGRPRAALAEADCRVGLADKSPGDAVARQAARNALEGLFSQANLPVAAHLEAGYKLGHFLEPGDNVDAARNVYAVVVTPFLQDPARIAALDTQGGRYWLSRCVLALAGLYEKQNDLASARTMYEFILQHGLAGPDQAQSLLNTLPTAAAPAAVPAAPAPAAPPPAPDAPLQRPPPA